MSDTRVPEVEIDSYGRILFQERQIEPGKLARALRKADIRKDQQIRILIPKQQDRKLMGHVAGELRQGGFTRFIFVTNRAARSSVQEHRAGGLPPQQYGPAASTSRNLPPSLGNRPPQSGRK
ncbi:MAG: hypothetical protein IJR99_04295 [Kiritimatiellae bacterium]|nr:hypothetical protein [Kiritimatiellia bacterium]